MSAKSIAFGETARTRPRGTLRDVSPSDGRSNYRSEDFNSASDAFVVGYLGEVPVCCGALRKFDSRTVEVKRMYVRPIVRSEGIGALLLAELERKGYHPDLREPPCG